MLDNILDANKEIPLNLLKAMQEPLITRWWMIGVLATKAQQYLPSFIKLEKGVRNRVYWLMARDGKSVFAQDGREL
jgi:hypothetical protein